MSQTILLSAKSTRVRLGVGETTLWRWRKDGVGPRWCRMGARIMYDLESVEQYIRDRIDADSGRATAATGAAA